MNDTDKIWFGKYKGTPLQDVPASYFHWLWYEGGVRVDKNHKLHTYIESRKDAFRKENKDLIWT
jgi:hypothetical protein